MSNQTVEETVTSSQDPLYSRKKGIPIERLIELKEKRLTDEDIASLVGCDRSNVSRRLQPYHDLLHGTSDYKKSRADIKAMIQFGITKKQVNFITDPSTKIDNWRDFKDAEIAKATEYDKERLERDQSTSIISYTGLSQSLSEIDKEIELVQGSDGTYEPQDIVNQDVHNQDNGVTP